MANATAAMLRLAADLKAINQEPPSGCSASPNSDDNMFVWSATIFGPDETPWEGGVFSLRITFSENYPGKPPRVRFRLGSYIRFACLSIARAIDEHQNITCSSRARRAPA